MILGFPRAKQGLCHYDTWGSGGYHFVSTAHSISSFFENLLYALAYFRNFEYTLFSNDEHGSLYQNCKFHDPLVGGSCDRVWPYMVI